MPELSEFSLWKAQNFLRTDLHARYAVTAQAIEAKRDAAATKAFPRELGHA